MPMHFFIFTTRGSCCIGKAEVRIPRAVSRVTDQNTTPQKDFIKMVTGCCSFSQHAFVKRTPRAGFHPGLSTEILMLDWPVEVCGLAEKPAKTWTASFLQMFAPHSKSNHHTIPYISLGCFFSSHSMHLLFYIQLLKHIIENKCAYPCELSNELPVMCIIHDLLKTG